MDLLGLTFSFGSGIRPCHVMGLYVDRMQSLWPLDYLETHWLPRLQRPVTVHLNCRIMCKEIFIAAFGYNEAKSLGIVEPFDLAVLHATSLVLPQGLGGVFMVWSCMAQ